MRLFERDRNSDVARRRTPKRFEAEVEGMEGRMMLTGSGATILLAGSTVEVIGSNSGDTGVVSLQNGSVDVNVSNAQGSDDVQFPAWEVGAIQYLGGSGSNTFTNATPLTAFLYGGSGNNTLTAGSGINYLIASSDGVNVLNAGSGFSLLEAMGNGTTTMNGGSGFDEMIAFAGNNHFVGGSGQDFIVALGGQNVIDAGPGYSTVYSFSSTDVIHTNNRMTVYHIGY